MINCGIIGFGKMGQIRARALEHSGRDHILSVYEENTLPDCLAYVVSKNADEIINNPDINTVFICTPNYLNKPLAIQELNAGKHVFCEKPPAFNSKEVEEIIIAERESGKKLMYGFNHRHYESIQYMKKLTESKEYGKVIWMRGRYGKSVDQSFFNTWRANKELADDEFYHGVDKNSLIKLPDGKQMRYEELITMFDELANIAKTKNI